MRENVKYWLEQDISSVRDELGWAKAARQTRSVKEEIKDLEEYFELLEGIRTGLPQKRLEELLINAFEHAIECSEQYTADLIRATGITPVELEEIGYDSENFKSMHAAAGAATKN